MAVIKLYNLYSEIEEASAQSISAVDRELSVLTPGHKFTPSFKRGNWDGRTKFFKNNKKTKSFPTGLLSYVVKAINSAGEEVKIVDERLGSIIEVPEKIDLIDNSKGHITLRDYQHDAVESALKATRGVLHLATNAGKTECACGIIKCLLPQLESGQKIAFFTHSKEIFIQSHLRLEERLGIKVGKVGMGKWDVEQVTVVMIPTLSKYMDKPKGAPNTAKLKRMHKSIDELNEEFIRTSSKTDKKALKDKMEIVMKEKTDYEKEQQDKIMEKHKDATDLINSIYVMIGDEVHHASSETWYKLFMKLKNAHYRFGLTGTVDEESEGHEINLFRLLGCTGKIVSTVSNDFLIKKGYSAKPIIYMMTIPGISNIDNVRYQTARKLGIIENDARNLRFVTKIVERAKSGKQCLVIVNETQHGDILYKMLKGRIEDIAFSHGETTDTHRDECLQGLKDGTISVLIATTILDEGVDVSGINCLFLVAGGKSPRQLLQRIGRGLRKKDDGSNLEVYDSLDYHNEYLVDHTYSRFNSYQSEGFDIIKD